MFSMDFAFVEFCAEFNISNISIILIDVSYQTLLVHQQQMYYYFWVQEQSPWKWILASSMAIEIFNEASQKLRLLSKQASTTLPISLNKEKE